MPDYRKKPVQIEARELNIENINEIKNWVPGATYWTKAPMRALSGLLIPTLESPHEASFGDYIIKGIAGEFYPCKPDIFNKSYEMIMTPDELATLLSWNTDPEEEGMMPDRISTHDGDWVMDGDIYYFEPNKED